MRDIAVSLADRFNDSTLFNRLLKRNDIVDLLPQSLRVNDSLSFRKRVYDVINIFSATKYLTVEGSSFRIMSQAGSLPSNFINIIADIVP